jgi:hypothetical protein
VGDRRRDVARDARGRRPEFPAVKVYIRQTLSLILIRLKIF